MSTTGNQKPILSIQIDDADMKRFIEAFYRFKDEASKVKPTVGMEEALPDLDKSVRDTGEAIDKTNPKLDEGADKVHVIDTVTGSTSFKWTGTAATVGLVGRHIHGATTDLVKWERLTAVFTGLIGFGGLYGLNTLAAGVATRRQQAQGAGLSIGQLNAFHTDFGRLGPMEGVLRGFNEASTDMSKQQPLASLGIDSRGKNAADLFAEALPKVKDLVDNTDPSQLSNVLGTYHLDAIGIDSTMARTIRGMPKSEIPEMIRNFRNDAESMAISDAVAKKWQDFNTALERAKTHIGTALERDLVNIAPGLTDFSKAAVDFINALLAKGGPVAMWIPNVDASIRSFAKLLGGEDAKNKLQWVLDHLTTAESDIATLVKWFSGHGEFLRFLAAEIIAFRFGGPLGAAAAALGATVMPQGLNEGENADEIRRRLGGSSLLDVYNRQHGGGGGADDGPAGPPRVGSDDPSALDPKSRSELSGVNKELAENLLAASKASGIAIKINEGRRTQAQANLNAARGRGVSDSQHLYGAAADVKMIDPRTGQPTNDRALYEQFADEFERINRERHTSGRWLGRSEGKWHNDIFHFDQGEGFGQTHEPNPYGSGEKTRAEEKGFLEKQRLDSDKPRAPGPPVRLRHPNDSTPDKSNVTVNDNSSGTTTVTVGH